jgi:hypothetical protein
MTTNAEKDLINAMSQGTMQIMFLWNLLARQRLALTCGTMHKLLSAFHVIIRKVYTAVLPERRNENAE